MPELWRRSCGGRSGEVRFDDGSRALYATSRAELLPKIFGDELIEAFREFKPIWDSDWKMNPGKVIDA
jgi:hypothetical protein